MKNWLFIIGMLLCSVLFFFSGALTGYVYKEKSSEECVESKKKPRQPSRFSEIASNAAMLLWDQVSDQISVGEMVGGYIENHTSARVPTEGAISQARMYVDPVLGRNK
jgi:hypothetical protein